MIHFSCWVKNYFCLSLAFNNLFETFNGAGEVTFATKFDILSKPKVYCSVLDRRRQMRFQIYLILLLCDAGVPEK